MIFIVLISFYTSRLVLNALGVVDFGIYNVVVGAVSFFSVLSSSLSLSIQRFISFELGKRTVDKIDQIISTSILIHISIALFIFIFFYCVLHQYFLLFLNVPVDRQEVASYVLILAVGSLVFTTIQIPFQAIILSYEAFTSFAFIGIIEAILKLFSALLLSIMDCDLLLFYSITQVIVSILVLLLFIVYGNKCHPIKITLSLNKESLRKLIAFASWSTLGELAWLATLQGVNILLNVFFNPIVNAAYAIALSVYSIVSRFVLNIQVALNPVIIKEYASKNALAVRNLLFAGIKYSFFLLLLLALPITLNMEVLLKFWLKNVPEFTSLFCLFVFISLLIDMLSTIFSVLVKATGNIKTYQLVVSLVLFLNLLGSFIALKLKFPVYSIYLVYIFVSIVLLVVRLAFVNAILKKGLLGAYSKEVLLPISKVSLISLVVWFSIKSFIREDLVSLFLSSTLSVVFCVIVIYKLGLSGVEREQVKVLLLSLKVRIYGTKSS